MKLKEYNCWKHLSHNELEFVYLRKNGASFREIGEKLELTPSEVRKMRKNIELILGEKL